MGNPSSPIETLRRALAAHGLAVRGGLHPMPDDGLKGATLLLIGSAGRQFWRAVMASPEASSEHPIDGYTRRVIDGIAAERSWTALYPFDGPPYHPFQRWAARAEPGLRPSPLGILIHPAFGLWHAYRAALLLPERVELPPAVPIEHPCDTCTTRPCLTACPAGAVTMARYDHEACRTYLRTQASAACLQVGCLARRACPVGSDHAQEEEQAAYHVRRFAFAQR